MLVFVVKLFLTARSLLGSVRYRNLGWTETQHKKVRG